MEVSFTPDQQTRLIEFANQVGKNAQDVVREAVDRLLSAESISDDAAFQAAVHKGLASLDRGEFVDHEEVGSRIEHLLSK